VAADVHNHGGWRSLLACEREVGDDWVGGGGP
jgi:hypothetical protein